MTVDHRDGGRGIWSELGLRGYLGGLFAAWSDSLHTSLLFLVREIGEEVCVWGGGSHRADLAAMACLQDKFSSIHRNSGIHLCGGHVFICIHPIALILLGVACLLGLALGFHQLLLTEGKGMGLSEAC